MPSCCAFLDQVSGLISIPLPPAGGSGITPMLQLIKHVLSDPCDRTQLELLFANKSEEDIMLRDQLEQLAAKHPKQLKIWYTVDKAPPGTLLCIKINGFVSVSVSPLGKQRRKFYALRGINVFNALMSFMPIGGALNTFTPCFYRCRSILR